MVELTEEDNGSIVTVIVGDIIQIQLEGNPTTGYSWGAENLDSNLRR
jgi:predicted secreted protein